jgi:hypothetical protein
MPTGFLRQAGATSSSWRATLSAHDERRDYCTGHPVFKVAEAPGHRVHPGLELCPSNNKREIHHQGQRKPVYAVVPSCWKKARLLDWR